MYNPFSNDKYIISHCIPALHSEVVKNIISCLFISTLAIIIIISGMSKKRGDDENE